VDSRPPTRITGSLREARALVTGASGFLGSRLCRRLIGEGAEVHAVSRAPRQEASADGWHWWQGDAADAGAVHELMSRIKPDVVFHFGGIVTAAPDLRLVAPTFHSLLTSTVNVLTAVAQVGSGRVVLSGSLEEPMAGAADALVPASPYAAAKLAAGAYARMFVKLYGTRVVILRPYMTYGPAQNRSKIIPSTILSLLRGEAPQLVRGDRALDWIYVDDVVEAFVQAAWRPGLEGLTLDVGSGTAVPIRDVADRLVGLIAPELTPRYGARADGPEPVTRVADVGPTTAALGWRPTTSLERGLAMTVDWYRRSRPAGGVGS
jgi:UDP-glucose 4-epimerase